MTFDDVVIKLNSKIVIWYFDTRERCFPNHMVLVWGLAINNVFVVEPGATALPPMQILGKLSPPIIIIMWNE